MKAKDIRICKGALTDTIYAGKLNKAGDSFLEKHDVTNDFLHAVITRWCGFTQIVTSADGKKYEVSVKEI